MVEQLGVNLGGLIEKNKVRLEDLHGKSLAIDGYNALYQFLAIIRGPTGEHLTDNSGRVTSHLSGLFYRTVNMIEKDIRLVYVFDGEPPALKEIEIKRRMKIKEDALARYEDALQRGAVDEARRYAQMTSKLKNEMVDDAKSLLSKMGIPWIQAPSEGEAQAAHIASKKELWAVGSQDYDSLLFGTPILVRNLTISGRRKLPSKNVYIEVEPEIIDLKRTLTNLGLSREQLVDLAILLGTDYNPDGFKGVGPKTALKLIKEHGTLEKAIQDLPQEWTLDELLRIKKILLEPKVTDDYKIEWGKPDPEGIVQFLCKERDFSEERVRNALDRIIESTSAKDRVTLEKFFGA